MTPERDSRTDRPALPARRLPAVPPPLPGRKSIAPAWARWGRGAALTLGAVPALLSPVVLEPTLAGLFAEGPAHPRTTAERLMLAFLWGVLLYPIVYAVCVVLSARDENSARRLLPFAWSLGPLVHMAAVCLLFVVMLTRPLYRVERGEVWFEETPVANADPATFRRLSGEYGVDDSTVFFRGASIAGADPVSFTLIDAGRLWARDAREVYFADTPVGVKNPATFRLIDDAWADDGVALYSIHQFDRKGIVPSDFATTATLGDHYAVDRESVFHHCNRIEGADRPTFRVLRSDYAVDRRRVYFNGKPVAGADPETFVEEAAGRGRDARGIYAWGKLVDPATSAPGRRRASR